MGEGKDWYACYIQGIVFTQVARNWKPIFARFRRQGPSAAAPGDTTKKTAVKPTPPGDAGLTSQTRRFREKGVEYFRKALELEGNNRRVLFELGVALEQIGKRGESIDVMKKLVKLDSSDATILNYLGYMLVEENRELDYAGNLIERALVFEPENGAFLDSKGWLFYRKQDFPKARKFIEQALSHIPQDTTILEHYALILEKLGLSDQAMEKWRQILKLDPAHEMAHRKVN